MNSLPSLATNKSLLTLSKRAPLVQTVAVSSILTSTRKYSEMSAQKHPHIIDVVKQDHRDIEKCYDSILKADNNDTRTRWANQFVWEVARHSVGEEILLYPAFEKHIQGGKAVANEDRTEHQTVKDDLYKFQNLKSSDKDFIPTLTTIMNELKEHIRNEEEVQLPQIERALGDDESIKLAKSFSRTKHFVPTHSHPSAPNKPPFETAVALLTAPIDKLKDIFKKFPSESTSA
ncbi:hemerythrin HHE cation binding domain-containing protein [Lipomyces starkeyi]